MTPTPPDQPLKPEQIAAGLTEAQRELLISAPATVDGRVLLDCYPRHGLNAHLVVMYSMARDKLTPLGLAVRAHLQSKEVA